MARMEKTAPLKITIAGNGRVSLNSGESVTCNGACEATLRPTVRPVVISARPGAGSQFTKWAGACLGSRPSCTVPFGRAAHVNAFFASTTTTVSPPPASEVTVVAGKPTELRFTPSTTTVRLGTVTFHVGNQGSIPHDFFVCSAPGDGGLSSCDGTGTPLNGGTLTVTFAAPGTYEYLCTVTGHAQLGMRGLLTVR